MMYESVQLIDASEVRTVAGGPGGIVGRMGVLYQLRDGSRCYWWNGMVHVSLPIGATAWENLPPAPSVPGLIAPVSNFPTNPLFRSDGTYWRPLNGYVSLWRRMSSIASPLATLTGSGASQRFTLPDATVLPAGMLIPGTTRVWGMCKTRRLGNSGASGQVLMALGSGASDGINDLSFVVATISATVNLDTLLDGFADITSATSFCSTGYVPRNGTLVVSSFADRNTNFDCSGSNTSLVSIGVSSAFTVDQIALYGYEIGIYG